MYEIIKQIIDHTWISQYTQDQQYYYYISGALIIVLTAVFVDMVYKILYSITHKGNL